jgi:Cellulase (glycosyl hydrolase family 5)
MWQADTFDPKTIDRELGWAHDLGFTSVRVFLHDLPFEDDALGFVKRIDRFLEIADKHKIRVMFVLFDSCWHPEPKSGKQPAPIPHLHNSGWVQSPGVAVLKDRALWQRKELYVKGIMSVFKNDRRVLCWDLWNEPENNNASSYGARDLKDKENFVLPLVKEVFGWARQVKPSQPITAAPWIGDWSKEDKLSPLNRFLFDNSDIITFHNYESLGHIQERVEALKRYQRPILCTEYLARPQSSVFADILPFFKDENVGAYCWGFVAGKTQTIYPWDSWKKKYTAEPKVWFHDILRADGKPFDAKEVELIKKVTDTSMEVRLRYSVEVLDPLKPAKAFIECVVRNNTDKEVKVPTTYGGEDMTLRTAGNWLTLRMIHWAAGKKQETKLLKPGEEMVIYKEDLKTVLLLDMDKEKPLKPNEPRIYWTWMA